MFVIRARFAESERVLSLQCSPLTLTPCTIVVNKAKLMCVLNQRRTRTRRGGNRREKKPLTEEA